MNILDDISAMRAIDKSNCYGSILEIAKQCQHAWEDTRNLVVPESYRNVNKILMTGMGGSGLGARVIESVFGPSLKSSLLRLNEYDLPAWVDEKTLIICSSFSGTTEETVQNAKQAIERKLKWMAIGAGGELIELAKQQGVPYYKIIPTHNPSKQPRLATGYSVVGQLALAAAAGVLSFSRSDLDALITTMEGVLSTTAREVPEEVNPAKLLARKLYNRGAVFIGSRHMMGALHAVKNQMNENAKNFSTLFDIPELNHHLMEGLGHPALGKEFLFAIFVDSALYPERMRKRLAITREITSQNAIPSETLLMIAKEPLSQAFEFIQFGGLVNFYLGMLYGIDPAPIPFVDSFKIRLGQPLGEYK